MYIDAHCHLAKPEFAGLLDGIVARSRAQGITGWIQGGIEPSDWEGQERLKAKLGSAVITAFGLHPWWIAGHTASECEAAFQLLEKRIGQADALGECGLDFGKRGIPDDSAKERQRSIFLSSLQLAKKAARPLILHVVQAHEEALKELEKISPGMRGIVHGFSGPWEIAQRYQDLGFLISVGQGVVKPGFQTLKSALKSVPGESLVIETDGPLPHTEESGPEPLWEIAKAVGILRGETAELVLARSSKNLRRVFGGEI